MTAAGYCGKRYLYTASAGLAIVVVLYFCSRSTTSTLHISSSYHNRQRNSKFALQQPAVVVEQDVESIPTYMTLTAIGERANHALSSEHSHHSNTKDTIQAPAKVGQELKGVLTQTTDSGDRLSYGNSSQVESISKQNADDTFGYILASSYFDQITGSMANFRSMQCWGGMLESRIRVVEPFIVYSTFGMNVSAMSTRFVSDAKNYTKLGDLFNMKEWMKITNAARLAPIVDWNFFVMNAPKKLILVDRGCIGREEPFRKCDDCIQLLESLNFNKSAITFAKLYGFQIVHTLCLPELLVTAGEFKRLVYGSYEPSEVVVLFESWGGVQQNELDIRMPITGIDQCNRLSFYYDVPVSDRIKEDGEKYIKKYMPSAFANGYIAVMMRMQYIAIMNGFRRHSDDYINTTLNQCFRGIQERVRMLRNTQPVLLTLDCRSQGSYFFTSPQQSRLAEIISQSTSELYQMLVGPSSTVEDWDKSFGDIATFNNPGYIAILQKHLAAASTCLVMAGGGSFQTTTETLYRIYHNSPPCIVKVDINSGCT